MGGSESATRAGVYVAHRPIDEAVGAELIQALAAGIEAADIRSNLNNLVDVGKTTWRRSSRPSWTATSWWSWSAATGQRRQLLDGTRGSTIRTTPSA
jgi:hypothetical protein